MRSTSLKKNAGSALMVLILLLLAPSMLCAGGNSEQSSKEGDPLRLKLATTTSTENSGLLEHLLPPFEEEHNVIIDAIAVGTGQALELGRRGDADVLMVHAPELEKEFVEENYGIERVYFMYNDFIIVGPEDDPAGIGGMESASGAFKKIAEGEYEFISRGDNSGTHVKELSLWEEADTSPDYSLYREIGQGMGEVITLANEQQAYTLTDRGTFLSYQSDIELNVLLEGDKILFNPYGVIAVNSEVHPHVKEDVAVAFTEYCTSEKAREIIRTYKVQGEQLFFTP
ncbi:MAG: substrate-binding domain-containing protein [Spirochaetaceae bacterium]